MNYEKIINDLQGVNLILNNIEEYLEYSKNKKNNEAWKCIDLAYSELTKAIQVLKNK